MQFTHLALSSKSSLWNQNRSLSLSDVRRRNPEDKIKFHASFGYLPRLPTVTVQVQVIVLGFHAVGRFSNTCWGQRELASHVHRRALHVIPTHGCGFLARYNSANEAEGKRHLFLCEKRFCVRKAAVDQRLSVKLGTYQVVKKHKVESAKLHGTRSGRP